MANTASAKKRIRSSERRRIRNRVYSVSTRTYIKKARNFIEAEAWDDAAVAVQQAIRALDKAAQKGIIHKNNAARRKSRLVRHLHAARAAADSVVGE